MRDIPVLQAAEMASVLSVRDAAAAIVAALTGGFDPATDRPRTVEALASGQLLLMPSETPTAVGVKAVTVAPGNAALGLPRVHGSYLLFDARTLELTAVMDGALLSSLRTPAVSMAAAAPACARFERPVVVTIFGAGPQAAGHATGLTTGGLVEVGDLAHVVRDPVRAREALGSGTTVIPATDPAVADRLRETDVIVTATTSRGPLFDSSLVADHAVVIVVGSHEATWREVDGALLGRSTVVVEDRATALREAGDVVFAIREGHLRPDDLVPMADVVRGAVVPDAARPYVFKSVGMSWEDLVVAEAIMARHQAEADRRRGR